MASQTNPFPKQRNGATFEHLSKSQSQSGEPLSLVHPGTRSASCDESRAAPGSARGKLCGICCVNLHELFSPANALSLGWCTQDIDFSLRKKGFFVSIGASLKSPQAHPATAPVTQTVPRAGDSQGSELCSRSWFTLKILNK